MDCILWIVFDAASARTGLRSIAAHDVDVLHHREATTPNCFLNGTGVGALPNKLPEDRMACAFVYLYEGALCVSNGHKLPFFYRRLPWCAMEVTGTLRDG